MIDLQYAKKAFENYLNVIKGLIKIDYIIYEKLL